MTSRLGPRVINLPNALTSLRILCVPLVVWLLMSPGPGHQVLAALLFALAALTDLLDGFLARRSDQVTLLGKLLDPIVDKLLVTAGLVMLLYLGLAPAWMVWVIVAREVVVTGIRVLALKDGEVIESHMLGKQKAVFQMVAIFFLILGGSLFGIRMDMVGLGLLWVAVVLTVLSGLIYIWEFGQLVAARHRSGV